MANNENILSWNVTNWITVTLIASVSFFALGLLQKWMQGKVSQNSAA